MTTSVTGELQRDSGSLAASHGAYAREGASFQTMSRCECQAFLWVLLDERRQVLEGWAVFRGARSPAPAHSIGAERERFDIAWACPICGRNTLRTVEKDALRAVHATVGLSPVA